MIIYGYRRTAQQIGMLTLVCQSCHTPAAHMLRRTVTKFTFFFIPLFPLSSKYFTQCTFCGATVRIGKDQARQLQDQQRAWDAGQAQQPYGAVQGQQPQQGGYPAQQLPQGGFQAPAPGQQRAPYGLN